MAPASVCSFSFSTSSDEKPVESSGKTAIIKPSGLDTKDPVEVSTGKSEDSDTITNDPKETADSADSGFNFPKKPAKRRRKRVSMLLTLAFLAHLSVFLPLHACHDFILRILFQGPSKFQIHSVSLSAFSTTSWRSRQISADGNISLSVENILLRDKILYEFIEVSISQNDTSLSSNVLLPFSQGPGDKSLLNVNFSAKIDASSVTDLVKPDDSVTVDVVIRVIVTEEEHWNWSKNFTVLCKNLELQFLPDSEVAEMITQGPIKCQSHKARLNTEEDI